MTESTDGVPFVIAREITWGTVNRRILGPISVDLRSGECWAVTGPNGSGKSILTEILAGRRTPSAGTVRWPGLGDDPGRHAAVVSFESQERLIARERREDQSAIMHGRTDPGHTVADLIGDTADGTLELAARFGIDHLYRRGLRFLSTGELRKAVLAAAAVRDPSLLVLDEPYDGLDLRSRSELTRLIAELHSSRRCLVLVLNRQSEAPSVATHHLRLERGVATWSGPISFSPAARPPAPPPSGPEAPPAGPSRRAPDCAPDRALVSMRNVCVAYGSVSVLDRVSWTVCPEHRWMIVGPNGSGKTTLLSLINGDNPKAYGQDVYLFGRRKGSGESVWAIKQQIGYVSGDLQFAYPLRSTVRDAVLSGFYDSIGLFDEPTGYQREIADEWVERIGLAGQGDAKLRERSFGERRMVLVARAMVKRPRLLIADEPCQGLDDDHAAQVLGLLDTIGREHETCLLYVTHDPDEQLRCITHRLHLVPGPEGSRAMCTPV